MSDVTTYTYMDSPVGRILLARIDEGITHILFDNAKYPSKNRDGWRRDDASLREVVTQLEEYFAGERLAFDLPLAPAGTPFQKKVWAGLRTIPCGETRSYGQLAAQIGFPDASRAVFLKTGAETGRELLEMEAKYRPNSPMPPEHLHPRQHERFKIRRGDYRASVGGQERTYRTGDVFEIPSGVPHWMHNVSDGPGHLLWKIRPALRTEDMFRVLFGLARDGKTNVTGAPSLLQLAVILRAYREEFVSTSPPLVVQRILFGLLAPIGHLLGLSSVYTASK